MQERRSEAAAAIDRDVLAAWLGDDDAAIASLLEKFRDTAIDAEREISIGVACRRSRGARGRRAQAQGRGAGGRCKGRRRCRHGWSRPARPATAAAAASGSGRWPEELRHALLAIEASSRIGQ